MQCWYVYPSMRHKKCLQTHHHVSPPTFGVDILLLLLYSNIYKGIRSFVLVPWMQRQCPVLEPKQCKYEFAPRRFVLVFPGSGTFRQSISSPRCFASRTFRSWLFGPWLFGPWTSCPHDVLPPPPSPPPPHPPPPPGLFAPKFHCRCGRH